MIKFSILLIVLFFTGCSVKEYKLFQEKEHQYVSETEELNITYSSKIIPNDILKIDIYNMNQKANIMMSDKGYTAPDNSYVVYPDGNIILPLVNSVHVEGLTIKEINELLTERYGEFLNAPYVKASIKNHRIFVLGEVKKRGVVPIEGETISIIEVIAQSGGLTDHAIRSHIRVISEENGKYLLRTLDLSKLSTLNSHNLMLKHNSIVYIEPKGTKAVRVAINDYLPIMQAISSVLGTFLTIDYLKK
jgi:polysaccharide export outer membrane protein